MAWLKKYNASRGTGDTGESVITEGLRNGELTHENELHAALNNMKNGITCAMALRSETLLIIARTQKKKKAESSSSSSNREAATAAAAAADLTALDHSIKQWLGNVLCLDALETRRITFEHSSGEILEKVARGEAVHSVRSLSELKRRLHNGRRCFALFHSSLPTEPLAFVHVALTKGLAPSLR